MTGCVRRRDGARAAGALAVALAAATLAGAAGGATVEEPEFQTVVGNDTPSWSPDGRRIAFTSFRNVRGDIYAIGVDGRGETRLTTSPAHDDHAAWSPDGSRIAFVSTRDGNPEIYVMNADGTGQRRLFQSPGREYYPTWAPDGSRIAFQSDRDGGPHIHVVGADGGGEARLTSGLISNNWRPSWSPSGPIAFHSNREGPFKIFLVDPDGAFVRRADQSPLWSQLSEQEPAWSPDGRQIAFVATRDPPLGNTEIYVANADVSEPRRITNYWARDVSPAWSPDGRLLAFTRGPSAWRPEIWIVGADGRGLRQLTSTATRFQVTDTERTPAQPIAGRRFRFRAIVAEPTGDVVERGRVTCRARLGTRTLRPVLARFEPSLVTCAWNLPAGAGGQALRFGFDVRSGRSGVSQAYSVRVR